MAVFTSQLEQSSSMEAICSNKLAPVAYTWNTPSKTASVVSQFFSFIASKIHSLVGIFVVPASRTKVPVCAKSEDGELRNKIGDIISLQLDLVKYQRIAIVVDGMEIDAMILGSPARLKEKRWLLYANANGELYEERLFQKNNLFANMLRQLDAAGIVFNYPGVGLSTGALSRENMKKAYLGVLNYLENEKQATEIIEHGHSIGAGVQAEASETHVSKEGVKHVYIKSRPFSDLSTAASKFISRIVGLLVRIFGWNIDCVSASKKLQSREIILQTAKVDEPTVLSDTANLANTDGIIHKTATLAHAVIGNPNKTIIGIKERHNQAISDFSFLKSHVDEAFKAG